MFGRTMLAALILFGAGPALAQDDQPRRTPRDAHRFLGDAFANGRVREYRPPATIDGAWNTDRVYRYRIDGRCQSIIWRGTNGPLNLDWSSLRSVTANGHLLEIQIDGHSSTIAIDMRSDSFATRAAAAIEFLHDHCRNTGF